MVDLIQGAIYRLYSADQLMTVLYECRYVHLSTTTKLIMTNKEKVRHKNNDNFYLYLFLVASPQVSLHSPHAPHVAHSQPEHANIYLFHCAKKSYFLRIYEYNILIRIYRNVKISNISFP